jgi:hypothetical protein
MKGSNKQHAISMGQYGVGMIVFTTQEEIDEMAENCMSMPLSQVRSIHKRALKNALDAERYFDAFPERLNNERQRYHEFCNDCAIVSVTGMIGFEKPMHLVHPSVISKINWDPNFDLYRHEAGELVVDYDPDIPVLQ